MTTVQRFGVYVSFFLSAPFILLTAALFAVIGPVLWIPLVVRSLFTYAVLLLLHAVAGREMRGSTYALEASIAWYFASFPRILSHLFDPFLGPDFKFFTFTEEKGETPDTDRYNPLLFEFWRVLFLGIIDFIKQTIWAALFWTSAIVGFAHYGYGSAETLVHQFLTLPAVHNFLVLHRALPLSQPDGASTQNTAPSLARPTPRPHYRYRRRQ